MIKILDTNGKEIQLNSDTFYTNKVDNITIICNPNVKYGDIDITDISDTKIILDISEMVEGQKLTIRDLEVRNREDFKIKIAPNEHPNIILIENVALYPYEDSSLTISANHVALREIKRLILGAGENRLEVDSFTADRLKSELNISGLVKLDKFKAYEGISGQISLVDCEIKGLISTSKDFTEFICERSTIDCNKLYINYSFIARDTPDLIINPRTTESTNILRADINNARYSKIISDHISEINLNNSTFQGEIDHLFSKIRLKDSEVGGSSFDEGTYEINNALVYDCDFSECKDTLSLTAEKGSNYAMFSSCEFHKGNGRDGVISVDAKDRNFEATKTVFWSDVSVKNVGVIEDSYIDNASISDCDKISSAEICYSEVSSDGLGTISAIDGALITGERLKIAEGSVYEKRDEIPSPKVEERDLRSAGVEL